MLQRVSRRGFWEVGTHPLHGVGLSGVSLYPLFWEMPPYRWGQPFPTRPEVPEAELGWAIPQEESGPCSGGGSRSPVAVRTTGHVGGGAEQGTHSRLVGENGGQPRLE